MDACPRHDREEWKLCPYLPGSLALFFHLNVHANEVRFCYTAGAESVDLGRDLRACICNPLPGDVDASGPRTTLGMANVLWNLPVERPHSRSVILRVK